MAIQTIPGGLWIPGGAAPYQQALPTFIASGSMTTANTRFAMIFQVPKTGTLDWFEHRQGANLNAPDNGLRFSFQDVNSVGAPDNTEDQFAVLTAGFGAGAWLVPPGYMGSTGTGTGTKRSVTRGDWLACVIRFENFVAGDSVTMSIIEVGSTQVVTPSQQWKYTTFSTNAGVAYTKNTASGVCIALKYSDGTYAQIGLPDGPLLATTLRTFNSGSTPDERGLLFQIPFPARLSGAWIRMDIDNPVSVVLYDAADNVLATASYIVGQRPLDSGLNGLVVFPNTVNLAPNVDYRLTALPTTASSIAIYDFDVANSALLAALDGGSTWMSTNRTNAGAWTNVNTNRPFMGIVLDGFDDAVPVGSGEHSSVF